MKTKPEIAPIDLSRVRSYPLVERASKVDAVDFAGTWDCGGSLSDFLNRLPAVLAAAELKHAIAAVAEAGRAGKPVIFGMGAHVIKVGLGPIVIDLMARGIITGVAMNGAGIVHDTEVAMVGRTSEEVGEALANGAFGMAEETGSFLGRAVASGSKGLGRSVGQAILDAGLPFVDKSILAAGRRLGLPVTVHVAVGTDIIHMHPGFDPARTGAASHLDFRILAAEVAGLEGGVYINAGSAVILPEVFLKALNLARNLGHRVERFTTVDLDFIRHYRPTQNVVTRPTARGGKGISLVGHHEIMIPLIAAGVIEALGT